MKINDILSQSATCLNEKLSPKSWERLIHVTFLLTLMCAACQVTMEARSVTSAPELKIQEEPFVVRPSDAEQAPVPYHNESYTVQSGSQENLTAESVSSFRTLVQSPGAAWLQIHFGKSNLGKRSYISIRSLQDGGFQYMDSGSLYVWGNSSAYFNGDAVDVVLHVAPGEHDIYFQIDEITVGEWVSEAEQEGALEFFPAPESICAIFDDRVSSNDPAVGRIMPIGCTGWIVSNGANLTAGHCISVNTQILQFNVPPSQPDGTPVNPPPEDQYPIEPIANIDFTSGGLGNDWAVFETYANSNTGLHAVEAQGGFYRLSRDENPLEVRVTGFGVDSDPPGTTGNLNSDSQTQQTHAGAFLGETVVTPSEIYLAYVVDTEGGNSGSPVINTANLAALGIHTNGGCDIPTVLANHGSSFENDDLESALQTYPGLSVTYVDGGHPVVLEDGTILRPYDTVLEGSGAAIPSSILSLVMGNYPEVITISKVLLLEAPVGPAIIGE